MQETKVNKKSIFDTFIWILLYWCLLQDFVLCLMYKMVGSKALVKIIFYSKDIITCVLFMSAIFRMKFNKILVTISFLYLSIVALYSIISFGKGDVSIINLASSIRGIILPPILFMIGYSIKDKNNFFNSFSKYCNFLVFLAIIGLAEFFLDEFFGTKRFWIDFMQLDKYYSDIKGQPVILESGTPGNWYTDIGQGYRTQKRLISIFAAPLMAGFIFLIPCIYYGLKICLKKTSKTDIMKLFIVSVSVMLTFTRQVIFPLILFYGLLFIYRNRKNGILIIGCVFFAFIVVMLRIDSIYSYIFNGSTHVHLLRISESLKYINFFGNGIGTFSTRFEGAIQTESQYLTLMGQIGIIPLFIYLYILVNPIYYCYKHIKLIDKNKICCFISIIVTGLAFVLAGMVSETVVAFTSSAYYYVFIGVIYAFSQKEQKKYEENKNYSDVFATISLH